jgi:tRNA C32,U32 (ribose-2'-O)-methylase TrmJ
MYVMICTRLDVFYALSIMSKYQSNPGKSHWKIVKHILKYLRKTKNVFLVYGKDELVIHGHLDVSV